MVVWSRLLIVAALAACGSERAPAGDPPPQPGSPPEPTEYVACGCGCCGGPGYTDDASVECVPSAAELRKIIAADQASSPRTECAAMGCSKGQRYRVCTPRAGSGR